MRFLQNYAIIFLVVIFSLDLMHETLMLKNNNVKLAGKANVFLNEGNFTHEYSVAYLTLIEITSCESNAEAMLRYMKYEGT